MEQIDYEQVVQNHDLVAVVMQDTSLRRIGPNTWRGACPIHNDGTPGDFSIFYSHKRHRWMFKCHAAKCEAAGDVVEYVRLRNHLDTPHEAVALLHGHRSFAPRPPVQELAQEPPKPLEPATAASYHGLLDLPVDPHGLQPDTYREYWHREGFTDETIRRFQLGGCSACPTAYNRDGPDDQRHPSLTIPVTYQGQVLNIRHRLLFPWDKGDKYRPHRKGLGQHLFNRDSLIYLPDGTPRQSLDMGNNIRDDVLLVEGEKKTMMLCQFGIDRVLPIISATGGVTSWVRPDGTIAQWGSIWLPILDEFERVIVLFDPKSELIAEQTARLFGRRGHVVGIWQKVDDYLRQFADPVDAQGDLYERIQSAIPVRGKSYWGERLTEARPAQPNVSELTRRRQTQTRRQKRA